MRRMRNLRDGLMFCAITTFVLGAGSQLLAQNQPETQNRSTPPAASEPRNEGAEQANHQNGESQHVGLGFHFEQQDAAGNGTAGNGLEIVTVDPNSPAAQAGLQPHDRVISIDGRPFRHHRHAKAYLSAQTGRPVPLIIERNGRQLLIHFVPGQPEGDSGWLGILLYGENEMYPNAQNGPGAQPNAAEGNRNNQNDQRAQGTNPSVSGNGQNAPGRPGARVAQIYPGSPAARAGLQPGDLVTEINGTKIDDPAELIALVHEMKPQSKAEFEVTRDNQSQKIPVTIGSRHSEYAEGQAGPDQEQAGPDQNSLQRLEEEVRQLREEIHQLREQLQKK
jgi:C-terminal processing protease CtpA/Prc